MQINQTRLRSEIAARYGVDETAAWRQMTDGDEVLGVQVGVGSETVVVRVSPIMLAWRGHSSTRTLISILHVFGQRWNTL